MKRIRIEKEIQKLTKIKNTCGSIIKPNRNHKCNHEFSCLFTLHKNPIQLYDLHSLHGLSCIHFLIDFFKSIERTGILQFFGNDVPGFCTYLMDALTCEVRRSSKRLPEINLILMIIVLLSCIYVNSFIIPGT